MDLQQFEALSIQFERIIAIQTMMINELLTFIKEKCNPPRGGEPAARPDVKEGEPVPSGSGSVQPGPTPSGQVSFEVRAALGEVNDRVLQMRNLNDLALNRAGLFAYSTFKASKCIYLEAAGVPSEAWGPIVQRKWKAGELFDGKEMTLISPQHAQMLPMQPRQVLAFFKLVKKFDYTVFPTDLPVHFLEAWTNFLNTCSIQ